MGHLVKVSAAMIGLSAIVAGAIAFSPHFLKSAETTASQASSATTGALPAPQSLPVGALARASDFASPAPAADALAKPAGRAVADAHRRLADAMAKPNIDDGLSQITLAAGGASPHSALGRPSGSSRALAFAEPGGLGDDAAATAELVSRARAQLRDGAASSARLLLTRAARGGSAEALTLLGESFDAAALAELGVKGVRADAAEARKYYRKAAGAGSVDAKKRLAKLGG